MKRFFGIFALFFFLAAPLQAAPNHSYFQFGMLDAEGWDGMGFDFRSEAGLFINYITMDDTLGLNASLTETRIGYEHRSSMSDNTDFVFSFGLWNGEGSSFGSNVVDVDGQEWTLGIRSMMGDSAQLEVTFADLIGVDFDTDMETIIGISWALSDSMSFVFQKWDEADMTAIGLRMNQ